MPDAAPRGDSLYTIEYSAWLFISIVTKSVSKRLGKKFAYGISCLLGGTGCLWIHWGEYALYEL